MSISVYIFCSILYIALLFFIAYVTDSHSKKGGSTVSNPYIYALSLAVYCTAWTFYGSVGKAAKSGVGFLPIYLGPTIFAPLWLIVLRKMIIVSKAQRITSIADFISSRYGKSTYLGVLVTIVAFFGIIPYISLQLKAIADSFVMLSQTSGVRSDTAAVESAFYSTAFYISIALALFTILFGTRNIEPNERHEGLVTAVAFESIVKLVAFLAVGLFVTFYLYDGFGDLFSKAVLNPQAAKMLDFSANMQPSEWFWLSIISMFAIVLLPRQFHIGVVENSSPNFVSKALWLFPLYLLIINIFVIPITLVGLMEFGGASDIRPDNYVLEIPLKHGQHLLALLVFIGGFSAATSMVIVETTALSIMISNHIIMPPLLKSLAKRDNDVADFSQWVIGVRRLSILLIMLIAFAYVQTIAKNRELVSIGLVSFAAVTQFAPAVFGGLFWKGATKQGAFAGLIVGFLVWAITLPLPSLAEYHVLFTYDVVQEGYFHQPWLRPHALLGLTGFDPISHAAFWSLLLNIAAYIMVSLNTQQTPSEASQADFFVNVHKYLNVGSEIDVLRREAKIEDLLFLMNRFLGEERTRFLLKAYEEENNVSLSKLTLANADLVNYVETILAGALGASSAKILLGSVVKEDPISLDEMLKILDQTQEIIVSNKVLEDKKRELEEMTQQLQEANEQLKELDRLKAEFITTVTHELRTPMTSIKALSRILLDNPNLTKEKQDGFLKIVVDETERITRLINQVLDIEKLQSDAYEWQMQPLNMAQLVEKSYQSIVPILSEKNIQGFCHINGHAVVEGDSDRITQVVVNLLSNAVKFTRSEGGEVAVSMRATPEFVQIIVKDNGIGISPEKQTHIFGRFTQIDNPKMGKPTGSGLGLFITKQIVEHHKGRIWVESQEGNGAAFYVELPTKQAGEAPPQ